MSSVAAWSCRAYHSPNAGGVTVSAAPYQSLVGQPTGRDRGRAERVGELQRAEAIGGRLADGEIVIGLARQRAGGDRQASEGPPTTPTVPPARPAGRRGRRRHRARAVPSSRRRAQARGHCRRSRGGRLPGDARRHRLPHVVDRPGEPGVRCAVEVQEWHVRQIADVVEGTSPAPRRQPADGWSHKPHRDDAGCATPAATSSTRHPGLVVEPWANDAAKLLGPAWMAGVNPGDHGWDEGDE
jgi:hypothetical protein